MRKVVFSVVAKQRWRTITRFFDENVKECESGNVNEQQTLAKHELLVNEELIEPTMAERKSSVDVPGPGARINFF